MALHNEKTNNCDTSTWIICQHELFDLSCNETIISLTIEFIISTERFSNSLV